MPGDRGFEQAVAQHYTRGGLERAVLDALRAAGKDPDRLEPYDLAPVDEFHIGGRQATIMHQIAKGYSEEQIAALARFFSGQPGSN